MEVNKRRGLWLSFYLTYTTWFHRIVENSLKVQHVLTLLKVSDFHNMKLSIYWCKFPKRYCKGIWHQTFLKIFISFTNLKNIETNKHYSWHVHGSVCLLIWKTQFSDVASFMIIKKTFNIKCQQVCRKLNFFCPNTKNCVEMWQNFIQENKIPKQSTFLPKENEFAIVYFFWKLWGQNL
jgi:hypothetical protein